MHLRSTAGLSLAAGLLLAGVAAEAKKKPPPPPPPPAPVQRFVTVPWKPIPPNYASPSMAIPPVDDDGLRRSVNRKISPAQITWNLRSGYNVAALNCLKPEHSEIVVNYRAFLKKNAKALGLANRKVDAEWRAKYGASFIRPREKYMTEVYNHFAMPPTLGDFCTAALAVSRDAKLIKLTELDSFAARSLPSLEVVFDDFFRRYDQWRVDMAAWEAKWGKDAVPGSQVLMTPANSTN